MGRFKAADNNDIKVPVCVCVILRLLTSWVILYSSQTSLALQVHLLCLLANGIYRSNTCNSPDLQAVALSVVPAKFANIPAARVDVVYLTNLVKWYVHLLFKAEFWARKLSFFKYIPQ